jgi:hypothetical protein
VLLSAAPYANNAIGFVRDAYLAAGITHDYLNASSAKEALLIVSNEPGWVGGGNAAFIPLGAIVFWSVCTDLRGCFSLFVWNKRTVYLSSRTECRETTSCPYCTRVIVRFCVVGIA